VASVASSFWIYDVKPESPGMGGAVELVDDETVQDTPCEVGGFPCGFGRGGDDVFETVGVSGLSVFLMAFAGVTWICFAGDPSVSDEAAAELSWENNLLGVCSLDLKGDAVCAVACACSPERTTGIALHTLLISCKQSLGRPLSEHKLEPAQS